MFRAPIASHGPSGGARPDSASPPEPAISLSWLELAYCGVVIVACYALRGSTGFGAAAAVPLLALVVPVKILVPVWTLLGIASSLTIVARDYRAVAGTALLRTLPTGLIGIAIGLYVFTQLDSRTLARGLGVLVQGREVARRRRRAPEPGDAGFGAQTRDRGVTMSTQHNGPY